MAEVTTTPVKEQPPSTAVSLADAPLQRTSSQPPLSGQAKINQMSADAQDNTDAAAAALKEFTNQLNNVYGGIQQSAREAAAAKEAVTTTEGIARLKQQQVVLTQATELGTNPDAASFALNSIAAEYKTNNQRAQKYADRIDYAMDPANVLDNPFKYLGNLIMFDFNKEGQASAERASARSLQQYQGLNNMTQEYAKTQAAIAQTMNADTIAQNAKVAAFQLNNQAQMAEIEQLRANSEMVTKALQLQNTPLDIERARQSSEIQAAHLTLARSQAAKQDVLTQIQLNRERRADAREARQEQKFRDAEDADAQQLAMINRAAAARGIPLHFQSQKDLLLAYKSPELKSKIDRLLDVGLTDMYYKQQDAGRPGVLSLGSSPSATLGMVNELGAKTAPGQAPIIQLISGANKGLATGSPAPKNAREQMEYDAKLDSMVKETAAKQYKDISAGAGNIYAPAPLSTFLADDNFVKGAPFLATQVFKTDKDLGSQTINFKGMMQQVVAAVRDKKLTMDQADSELRYLAAKVMSTNNALRQYEATAGLPTMKNVNIPVWAGGAVTRAFTDAEPMLDLADDTKRRAYLSSQMSSFIQPAFREQALKNIPQKQAGAR